MSSIGECYQLGFGDIGLSQRFVVRVPLVVREQSVSGMQKPYL